LIPHSEYHSADTYSNNFVSVSDNQAISPQGVQNAAKIILDSGTNSINGGHYYVYTSTSSEKYTISVFAKAAGYRYFTFTYGSTNAAGGHFDLQEGVKLGDITNAQYTNTSASIEDYGNGWYRLIVSVTDTSSAGRYLSMRPSPSASVPSNNNYSSTGDGTSGAYIYGLQLEAGSYPTSYIPNHSGGSVTRSADSSYLQNSSVLSSGEGTIFWEIGNYDTNTIAAGFNQIITISKNSDNSLNDIIYFEEYLGINKIYVRKNNTLILTSSVYEDLRNSKIVIKFNSSGCKIFINGTEESSYVGDASNTFEFFGFRRPYNGAIASSLALKNKILFPTALSNTDCEVLTGATAYESFSAMATALNYTTYE